MAARFAGKSNGKNRFKPGNGRENWNFLYRTSFFCKTPSGWRGRAQRRLRRKAFWRLRRMACFFRRHGELSGNRSGRFVSFDAIGPVFRPTVVFSEETIFFIDRDVSI
jgi:hypothetical protein